MAEQRRKSDLAGVVSSRAQASAYSSAQGQEITAAQRELNVNRTNQKLSMQDYLNNARNQQQAVNRQIRANKASGMTGGSSLFNQQNSAIEIGTSVAQTQQNYNDFTNQADRQNTAYSDQLSNLGTAMEGDVASNMAATEQTETFDNARASGLTTASNIVSGLGIAASVIGALIPGFGTLAAIGIGAGFGALAGGLSGGATEGANAWDVTKGALIQGGIGAALGAIPGARGGGSVVRGASAQITTNATKEGIKATLNEGAKAGIKNAAEGIVADSASQAAYKVAQETGTDIFKTATEELTKTVVDDAFKETLQGSVKKLGSKLGTWDNIATKLGSNGQELLKGINDSMVKKGVETFTSIDNYLVQQGLQGKALESTRAILQKQAVQGLQAEAVTAIKTTQKEAAQAILKEKGFLARTTTKLGNLVTGAGNFNTSVGTKAALASSQAQASAIASGLAPGAVLGVGRRAAGRALLKQTTKVGLKGAALGTAGYVSNTFTSGAVQKSSANRITKDRWNSVFNELGRPDLTKKMGW